MTAARIALSAALHPAGWLMGATEARLTFRLVDARLDPAQARVAAPEA